MTKYNEVQPGIFMLQDMEPRKALDKIPSGTYTISQTPRGEWLIIKIDDMTLPSKIYGNQGKYAQRIFTTFLARPSTTGVLLSGEKGSGKTLLSKILSAVGREKNIPTFVINAPWHGESFNRFIQDLEQELVIIFDEFEKVYDENEQKALLTLLDGVYPSKKLFILTCNDYTRIDSHMHNRPGRIFYKINYKGLDIAFIKEYCQDRLNNKSHIEKVCQISQLFQDMNFDMLAALIEEMNRYKEDPMSAMEILNASREVSYKCKFNVVLFKNGSLIGSEFILDYEIFLNPLAPGGFGVSYYGKLDKKKKRSSISNIKSNEDKEDPRSSDDYKEIYAHFEPKHLSNLHPETGEMTFINEEKEKIILTKVKEENTGRWGSYSGVF